MKRCVQCCHAVLLCVAGGVRATEQQAGVVVQLRANCLRCLPHGPRQVSPLVMMITVIRNWSVSYISNKQWVTPGQSLDDDDNSDKEWVTPGQSLGDDDK